MPFAPPRPSPPCVVLECPIHWPSSLTPSITCPLPPNRTGKRADRRFSRQERPKAARPREGILERPKAAKLERTPRRDRRQSLPHDLRGVVRASPAPARRSDPTLNTSSTYHGAHSEHEDVMDDMIGEASARQQLAKLCWAETDDR